MKSLTKFFMFISLLAAAYSGNLYSQTDSIYVAVKGDTATIWHVRSERNCASRFLMKVQVSDFHMTVTELDTIGPIADCICLFNLSVKIGPLGTGKYIVDVYGADEFYHDTTYFGSTSFSIGNSAALEAASIISQYQSDCLPHTGTRKGGSIIPGSFDLEPLYPNPFNSRTRIRFSLPAAGLVNLSVYNTDGEEVASLLKRNLPAGDYNVAWDADSFASGVYFVRIQFGDVVRVQKAVLTK